MSPHRPLHQWCVWCWEKVLVQLWWFSCFQDNRIRNQVQSREKWIHILLPQQVSCLLHAEHDIKKKLRKFIHLYGRISLYIFAFRLFQGYLWRPCRAFWETQYSHWIKMICFWTIRGYVFSTWNSILTLFIFIKVNLTIVNLFCCDSPFCSLL